MFNLSDILIKLVHQLYPTGRAFKFPFGGIIDRMHQGLNEQIEAAINDSLATLNSILPDNDFFDEKDASAWERLLGLINGANKSLEDRKAAILQKLSAPGLAKAQSHFLYLQLQLQTAGFDVFVHENIFPVYPSGFESRSAFEVVADIDPIAADGILTVVQHGETQHGNIQHGKVYNNIIANSIDQRIDKFFNFGLTFDATFFIGGPILGSFADVPSEREEEFRQLILSLKPLQNVGFLLINYT